MVTLYSVQEAGFKLDIEGIARLFYRIETVMHRTYRLCGASVAVQYRKRLVGKLLYRACLQCCMSEGMSLVYYSSAYC